MYINTIEILYFKKESLTVTMSEILTLVGSLIDSAKYVVDKIKQSNMNDELAKKLKEHASHSVDRLETFRTAKDEIKSSKSLDENLKNLGKAIDEAKTQLDIYSNRSCLAKMCFIGNTTEGLVKADKEMDDAFTSLTKDISFSEAVAKYAVKKCLHTHVIVAINKRDSSKAAVSCANCKKERALKDSDIYWECKDKDCENNFCSECKPYSSCTYNHTIKHDKAKVDTWCHYRCGTTTKFEKGTPGWICTAEKKECEGFYICDTCLCKATTRCWDKHSDLILTKKRPKNYVPTDIKLLIEFKCIYCRKTRKREEGRWACQTCMDNKASYEICTTCRPVTTPLAPTPDETKIEVTAK